MTLVASAYCIENYLSIRKRVALFLPISVLCNGRSPTTLIVTRYSPHYNVFITGVTNPLINSLSCLVRGFSYDLSRAVTSFASAFIVPHCRYAGFICTSLRLSTHLPCTFSRDQETTSGSTRLPVIGLYLYYITLNVICPNYPLRHFTQPKMEFIKNNTHIASTA